MKDRNYTVVYEDSEELAARLERVASDIRGSKGHTESVYYLLEAADHIRCMYSDICFLDRVLERGQSG